jgi:putative Holliday junction resolvase
VRPGRRLAVDVGKVRIGIAATDVHAILASGVATIVRQEDLEATVLEICELAKDIQPIEIYVGLPVSMSGDFSASTFDALLIAQKIAALQTSDVRLIDERLTTVTASSALRSSGRDSKSGRKIIDQIAATVILEQALSFEKSTGLVPGKSVEEFDE